MDIILASTSIYRKQLLARLGFEFSCMAPNVDESVLPGEAPGPLSARLARAKAKAIASQHPGAVVIGSDQVASIDGSCIGKPGDHPAAVAQLTASAGRSVHFYTGVSVICIDSGFEQTEIEVFEVQFRDLTPEQIESYLQREKPYDCAGSFKSEGLGIALFERMVGDDPTGLEGLPLITTCRLLEAAGVAVI